jgi:4-amino-4-deoxy-L-arabinose transferase-like glycosyltransferase
MKTLVVRIASVLTGVALLVGVYRLAKKVFSSKASTSDHLEGVKN